LDFSETMFRQAAKRNAAAAAEGRVDLRVGDAAALPFADGAFDKAFAVNVIYFWPEPGKVLEELRRVLRPGGRLAVYRATREALEAIGMAQTGVFAVYSDGELERMLAGAGFRRIRFTHKSFGKGEKEKGACALAER
jgi:SAM-dependent methyltransferase